MKYNFIIKWLLKYTKTNESLCNGILKGYFNKNSLKIYIDWKWEYYHKSHL